MQKLTSRPGAPYSGAFTPPGDKSITHRAWILGLLREGTLAVRNPNRGRDCAATRSCAESLGGVPSGDAIDGAGAGLREPAAVLDCGNSGTTLRLLAGVLAARPFLSVLTGDESLCSRPVARVAEPLRAMGAAVLARGEGRFPPLVIQGANLKGIRHVSPVASAQVLSCVLLAGLGARGRTEVELPGPARDHTERMLAAFGVQLDIESLPNGGRRVGIEGPQTLSSGDRTVEVPGDFSAAAFFLAAAAAREGARVTARSVNLNPTRTGLLDVLRLMGARIEVGNARVESGEEVGDVTVTGVRLAGVELPAEWLPRWIDEVPAWAVAASLARGTSRITGAAELRVKETDRLHVLATGLRAVGIAARELPDGLEIDGGVADRGAVDARGDHRLAMAFAVLGSAARGPIEIDRAEGIETSFPEFGEICTSLGGLLETAPEPQGGHGVVRRDH